MNDDENISKKNKNSDQNTSEESNLELNAEVLLYDVLDKIFSYLSIKTLMNASIVCRTWYRVAIREMKKRHSIDCVVLPLTWDEDEEDSDDGSDQDSNYLRKWHIGDRLRSIPDAALFFCNKEEPSCARNSTDACYCYYKLYLCTNKSTPRVAVIDGLDIAMNNIQINGQDNKVTGILIPKTPRLNIDAYDPFDGDMDRHGSNNTLSEVADKAVNSLLTREAENNCFIFINNIPDHYERNDTLYSRTFLTEFLNSLKRRCQHGSYSLWGGEVEYMTADFDGHDSNLAPWSVILRLSGPAIKSWSIVLELDLSPEEAENILVELKKKVKQKNHTCAVAMAPSNEDDSFEQRISKTEVFRKVFPNIPLISVFERGDLYQIGTNSTTMRDPISMKHTKSVAYLILTTE